ncbi:PREDICTED: testis development-related protein [Merops nubicus]|nr:PREDICTED: testis development-related protein [Merops nubicus]
MPQSPLIYTCIGGDSGSFCFGLKPSEDWDHETSAPFHAPPGTQITPDIDLGLFYLYPFFENKDQFLHDEVSSSVSQLATKVQGASFRGWKEVTSMFNKDDEQQLLAGCKSPKSKGTNLKLKEEVKSEKKPGFWDSLVIKQNVPSRKPDEIEGWEPPQITAADSASDAATTLSDYTAWSGWEDETKGSTKYTNLASSGNSSRWSIKSAGKLVSIRRQSKGNLTDNWEELE